MVAFSNHPTSPEYEARDQYEMVSKIQIETVATSELR
jgi:hypothetical protein